MPAETFQASRWTSGNHLFPTVIEVTDRAAHDEGFGDVVHLDCSLDAGGVTEILKGTHERHTIDNRRQHTHVVGCRPVHAAMTGCQPSPDIATANHNGNFNPHAPNLGDRGRHTLDDLWRDAV